MLLMVIVSYHASFIDAAGARCYQIMEAPDAAALGPWIDRWADLVDFEVIPVETSAGFWARVRGGSAITASGDRPGPAAR